MLANSRVLRRFFQKLMVPVGIVVYALIVGKVASVAVQIWGDIALIATLGIMMVVPMVAILCVATWRQSRYEIDQEDRDIMRRLRE
jgi:membrane protein YdbS with pleckstrin-like domain